MHKVFLGHSGDRSQAVATALAAWLEGVVHYKAIVSTRFESGDDWWGSLRKHLDEAHYGIFVMTPENTNAPWLLFEAGAIAAKLNRSACPYLCFGLKASSIRPPLSSFQARSATESDTLQLVSDLNQALPEEERKNSEAQLSVARNYWPSLQDQLSEAEALVQDASSKEPKRTAAEILDEVLAIVRRIDRSINTLPKRRSPGDQSLVDQVTERALGLGLFGPPPDLVQAVAKQTRPEGLMERLALWNALGRAASSDEQGNEAPKRAQNSDKRDDE